VPRDAHRPRPPMRRATRVAARSPIMRARSGRHGNQMLPSRC
jgi:hypothetical protein